MEFEPIRRRGLSEEVVDQLRAHVFSGQWPVGEQIPTEPALMAAFGVARGTIREALRALQYSGLLEVRRGDGTYVRASSEIPAALERTPAALADILEARAAIEPHLARLAAQRATESDMSAIEAALNHRAAATDPQSWIEADIATHTAIAAAAHNPVLFEIYTALLPRLRQSMVAAINRPGFQRADPRGHEEVLQAIRNRDAQQAADSATNNLNATEDWNCRGHSPRMGIA